MASPQTNDSHRQDPITLEMIDWRGCPVVEYAPARVSGQPSFIGQRMPVSVLVEWVEADHEIDEFAASYHMHADTLRRAVQYLEDGPPVHVVKLAGCPVVERGQKGEPVFTGTFFPVETLFDQINPDFSCARFVRPDG